MRIFDLDSWKMKINYFPCPCHFHFCWWTSWCSDFQFILVAKNVDWSFLWNPTFHFLYLLPFHMMHTINFAINVLSWVPYHYDPHSTKRICINFRLVKSSVVDSLDPKFKVEFLFWLISKFVTHPLWQLTHWRISNGCL